MRWFYGDMTTIYSPTDYYVTHLVENGIDRDRLITLSKGVDTALFNPERRDECFWQRYGLNGNFKFIYVGRVSKEKNLELLFDAFLSLRNIGRDCSLIMVGDGPELKKLEAIYAEPNIVFTGDLHGQELASAYASADVLVFPSLTDTFGNAVLEAHASGIPAIVSNRGGPQEIVSSNNSGLIIDGHSTSELVEAMLRIQEDSALYDKLREAALNKARNSRWETIVNNLLKDRAPAVQPVV